MSTLKKALPILIVLALIATIAYAVVTQIIFDNEGTLDTGLAAYRDSELTIPLTSIDWETLEAGQTYTKTIYLNSTTDIDLDLTLSTTSWSSVEAGLALDLSWDFVNPIVSEAMETVILTLVVDAEIGDVTDFSFVTVIDVVEAT